MSNFTAVRPAYYQIAVHLSLTPSTVIILLEYIRIYILLRTLSIYLIFE